MNFKYLTITILLLSSSQSPAADSLSLKGQPFTNPDSVLMMPAGWESKPNIYNKKIQNTDLVISFDQQTYPAFHKVVAQYGIDNNLEIVIQKGTCGVSAGKLLQKSLDAGTFCCPPGTRDKLPGLEFHTLAISALAIIVNGKNPTTNITTEQARHIFQGKIQNWKELESNNGFDNKIRLLARLHCKKRPGHWTLLLKNKKLFSPTLKGVGVIPDLIAKVGRKTDLISMETPFMIKTFKKGPIKSLTIDNHKPTDIDHIASEKYPFYRTYNMTSWNNGGKKRQEVMQLISFLQNYIEKNYLQYNIVPLSKLKMAGWKFKGTELIGEPNGSKLAFLKLHQ